MSFSDILINWYLKNKRDLPWRNTSDPYKIWISEIILQQTRVEQGLPYFFKFIQRFPDVKKLAQADEDEVLKLWQGLGYYSRARNMHFTAKEIVKKHKAQFPSTYHEIKALKGIGDYTAAAIASFAYNLPYAVVDGNVMRVLSRYLGIDVAIDSSKGKKIFAEAAQELLDKENPAVYNQAIMEFGATFCIPVKPDCENCIFNDSCEAFRQKKVNELPYKSKRTKITKRYFHYFILTYKDNTYIRKRKPGDIWQGLYEFPLYEANSHLEFDDLLKTEFFKKEIKNSNPHLIKVSAIKKHILSHQHIFALFYHLHLYRPFKNKQYIEIPIKTINNYAFPRLINRYLEEEKIIQ